MFSAAVVARGWRKRAEEGVERAPGARLGSSRKGRASDVLSRLEERTSDAERSSVRAGAPSLVRLRVLRFSGLHSPIDGARGHRASRRGRRGMRNRRRSMEGVSWRARGEEERRGASSADAGAPSLVRLRVLRFSGLRSPVDAGRARRASRRAGGKRCSRTAAVAWMSRASTVARRRSPITSSSSSPSSSDISRQASPSCRLSGLKV